MVVAGVRVRVLLERTGGFLAAALVSTRASLAGPGVLRFAAVCGEAGPARFAAVFPAGDEGRGSGSR